MLRVLVVVVVMGACGSSAEQPPVVVPPQVAKPIDAGTAAVEPGPEVRKIYVERIDNAATFEAYSREVGNERFAKFVLDTKSNAIYYFDVSIYPVHKDFIFGALLKKERTKALLKVVDRNYGAKKPDFMMVYVVHHLQQDLWTFAFWDGDLATSEHVARAYQRIKDTFYRSANIKFRPDSNYQERIARKTEGVPFIFNDQIYKLADYTAFNKGSAVGTLRIVPPDVPEIDLTFATDDIAVIKTSLSDITPVAGIISEAFSTPLSHVNLRARGWSIPSVGLRDAQTKYADLDGKVVFFEAKDAGYTLRAATAAEITAAQAKRDARKKVKLPAADLESAELETLDVMRSKDAVRFGPKAANLGEIMHAKLEGFEVPMGFGVPFRYYKEHLEAAGIDKQVKALLKDPAVKQEPALRKQRLEQLRAAIEGAALSEELKTKIGEALEALPENQGVFVRSSTNAEDLKTFSGAGLHDTIPNVKGLDAVCEALKKVWASTWTLRAYDARMHAGIDQRTVYGSALIQVGVPATAAGVVATVHPTDPTDEKNYTVNAKSGIGIKVVDGKKVPESLIVSWYNRGVRVLSRSDEDTHLVFDENGGVREVPNPNKGKPVLTNKAALHLAQVSHALTKLFKNPKLDIEWVYVGDQLYIVQTRPLVGL
ncbi:MAG: PEP/pyruvate-binding domain-containing protein [Kofleriaceae bacterium]